MLIAALPRLRFAHLPTPLEPMERLTRYLDGPRLFVKRDDCTGLAGGGNKTRKLEFLLAEALVRKSDLVITQGATQSNHVRQTAAIAARLGMDCHILLEDRTGYRHADYRGNGNVLLDRLLGAEISYHAAGTDMDAAMDAVAQECVRRGRRPYIIPGGGSNPTGALGYVSCAFEIVAQANDLALPVTWVVHGTGSAGTQAGLVAGVEACRSGIKVLGISVRAPKVPQEEKVSELAAATAARLPRPGVLPDEAVLVDDRFVGPGYGQPSDAMVEAVRIAARHEGLLLDPVYTGKAMAGLIALVREGYFRRDDVVVFLHTGGAQALAGYSWAFGDES